jgi:hypothetical protein
MLDTRDLVRTGPLSIAFAFRAFAKYLSSDKLL